MCLDFFLFWLVKFQICDKSYWPDNKPMNPSFKVLARDSCFSLRESHYKYWKSSRPWHDDVLTSFSFATLRVRSNSSWELSRLDGSWYSWTELMTSITRDTMDLSSESCASAEIPWKKWRRTGMPELWTASIALSPLAAARPYDLLSTQKTWKEPKTSV